MDAFERYSFYTHAKLHDIPIFDYLQHHYILQRL